MAHPDQLFGDVTYAQHGDDLVIRAIFHSLGIGNPSYLDLGAHHPENISNTKLFYDTGSRGINVEANPVLHKLFLEQRPQDINLNVGVGIKSGFQDFYMIDGESGRNSFIKEVAEGFVMDYPEFAITEVRQLPIFTVEQILHHRRIPDFLSIDIEGMDFEVLQSIDFKRYPFKVVCVEIQPYSEEDIRTLMHNVGYCSIIKCGSNLIFVDKNLAHKVR
jgi:FkbM family methyltransferase